MNMDKKIRDFLHSKRRTFKEKNREKSSNPKEEKKRKEKKKAENTEIRYKQLKEK
jgi:hypothetical protein